MRVAAARIQLLALLIFIFCSFVPGPRAMAAPLVQVGLSTTGPNLQIGGQCSVVDSAGDVILQTRTGNDIQLNAAAGKVCLDGVFYTSLRLVPAEDDLAAFIRLNDKPYRGDILVSAVGDRLKLVNELDLEEYLLGVVPLEMPPTWPLEALKAQAVAARTFALKNINRHRSQGYGLCDSSHCQVYGGVDVECTTSSAAVNGTAGMVAKYNGELIEAYYHACSGGRTETSGAVWGSNRPYLTVVIDEVDSSSPYAFWQKRFRLDQLSQLLADQGYFLGKIRELEIVSRTDSGRADQVEVKGSEGTAKITASLLRQALGLNSTMFDISREKDRQETSMVPVIVQSSTGTFVTDLAAGTNVVAAQGFRTLQGPGSRFSRGQEEKNEIVFLGRGYGHGVGLSQWGAKALAERVKPDDDHAFIKILTHYYKGITIESYQF